MYIDDLMISSFDVFMYSSFDDFMVSSFDDFINHRCKVTEKANKCQMFCRLFLGKSEIIFSSPD